MSFATGDRRIRWIMERQTESKRVGVHREIVEHHIHIVVLPADRAEPAEVSVRVCVAIHRLSRRAPVETEVRESVGGRLFLERIDGMHEAEVLAHLFDDVNRPRPAELEGLDRIGPDGLEEPIECVAVLRVHPDRDRKSTRLNSSHGYISYAV